MRLCIQRVNNASVTVADEVVAKIGKGLLVLVGIERTDTIKEAEFLARKLTQIRLWDSPDGNKTWNNSVATNNYEVLLVSQFTLYGITKGNKPDFHYAMTPSAARPFYDEFVKLVKKAHKADKVQSGIFGAMMTVDLSNDGPVTFILERNAEEEQKPEIKGNIQTEIAENKENTDTPLTQ